MKKVKLTKEMLYSEKKERKKIGNQVRSGTTTKNHGETERGEK
jgi:hypothetical protein